MITCKYLIIFNVQMKNLSIGPKKKKNLSIN